MIVILTWILAALSVAGCVLNVKKIRFCFVLWAFTNAAWVIYDFTIGAYAQAALFVVYFILSIWGLIKWGKNNER